MPDDFLADFFETSSSQVEDELEMYLNTCTGSEPDVLSFWQGKAKIWPILSKCAKWMLSIPATSTPSEQAFFLAGRTLEDCHSQLNPDTVDGLLFLHGLQNGL